MMLNEMALSLTGKISSRGAPLEKIASHVALHLPEIGELKEEIKALFPHAIDDSNNMDSSLFYLHNKKDEKYCSFNLSYYVDSPMSEASFNLLFTMSFDLVKVCLHLKGLKHSMTEIREQLQRQIDFLRLNAKEKSYIDLKELLLLHGICMNDGKIEKSEAPKAISLISKHFKDY